MQRAVIRHPCFFLHRNSNSRLSTLTRRATQGERRSPEEPQQRGDPSATLNKEENPEEAAKIRKASPPEPPNTNIVQGVLEEVRLISWPTPLQALNDTVSVVALVALLAVALFGLNTGFNEASKQYYNFAKATFPKLN